MSTVHEDLVITLARQRAESEFRRQIGVARIESQMMDVGNRTFLKFVVGRSAPIYEKALWLMRTALDDENPFRGLLGLVPMPFDNFPKSPETDVLLNLITRSTRHIAQGAEAPALTVPFVPFHNREDEKVTQPATHLIVGRRGVGKSTLITRAAQILDATSELSVVLDMQAYSEIHSEVLYGEVLADLAARIAREIEAKPGPSATPTSANGLDELAEDVRNDRLDVGRAAAKLKRLITPFTVGTNRNLYAFLDDFHVVDREFQPALLNLIHAGLKGANGWLKVAGLHSLLNCYDPRTRKGVQVPGDAQQISLDLTLVNPEAAESHLRAILESFLQLVGIDSTTTVILEAAFRRLVWANAGVPRDFLQMFGQSLEHARRAGRPKVTLTDTNLAIGEFGQQKTDDLEKDAQNEKNLLRELVKYLERYCLEDKKVNAFLVRSEQSRERDLIQTLSDLRIVHLIHPTITPHRAGERYEAFLLDYSLFTGFRRRPNIKELLPESGSQFKASELRKIPALPLGFAAELQ